MSLAVGELLGGLITTLVTSVVLIILGVIYFAVTLIIINGAAGLVLPTQVLSIDWAVASAALLATGAILSGALERK
ncbi:MAG: hypothetical protein PHX27_03885 [Candidatus ainarchaeum sp.]|nr:hypothetical protein [Candidatus ainarchaeum sp.]